MKKILFILLAAIVGGLAALGGAQFLGLNQTVKYVDVPANQKTNFARYADTSTSTGAVAPNAGFSVAAEKTLPAVVHIKASKRATAGRSGGNPHEGIDPRLIPPGLRDLFGNPGGERGGEERLQRGSGSGVIISADGYIVTNNHVVEGAENLEVDLNDQQTYQAEVIGVDPTTDIALIKIDAKNLPTVQFADSDLLKVGDWVVAVGNPFSLTSTVTAGIVSAKGRSIDIVRRSGGELAIESFIQTDAVVNPGNSGGALVDINGNLVGINTAISSPTGVFAGYSFAVPSAIVKKVTEDLREFGVVQRGLLGARIQELNTAFAKERGIDRDNGVYVSEVTEGSAAKEAGLREGDVILSVDGISTLRNSELLEQLGRRRPGDEVTLSYERAGRALTTVARLKNTDGGSGVVAVAQKPASTTKFGASFYELNESQSNDFGLDGGVVIRDLSGGLLSEQTRIRPTFIITKVNGTVVGSVEKLTSLLDRATGAVSLEGVYPEDPDRVVRYAFVVE
ncbi:trypsin-like peptidase domain-containing protein [Neolewinella antarctica]|uniref:Do/DeqQ family serine protease n=1 Tax=Neolewinella antarctica TaxID=442734 RepID=A0ABX0XF13_9BACT|nr:trypsin-like peptidase domain-containing protein [Neolewinella antarctica]NJC27787.1 Do/DeqQ family serine protease [Neolewinella antarctica]